VSYENRKSTWNSGVRKAIRRGSVEQEVRKHRDRVTEDGKQISKQRRRVDVSYDPSIVTAVQHDTWMDEEGFKKTCIREKKKRHQEITRVILCRLIYIVMSFKPFNDIIMIACKFLIGLCCLRSYST